MIGSNQKHMLAPHLHCSRNIKSAPPPSHSPDWKYSRIVRMNASRSYIILLRRMHALNRGRGSPFTWRGILHRRSGGGAQAVEEDGHVRQQLLAEVPQRRVQPVHRRTRS